MKQVRFNTPSIWTSTAWRGRAFTDDSSTDVTATSDRQRSVTRPPSTHDPNTFDPGSRSIAGPRSTEWRVHRRSRPKSHRLRSRDHWWTQIQCWTHVRLWTQFYCQTQIPGHIDLNFRSTIDPEPDPLQLDPDPVHSYLGPIDQVAGLIDWLMDPSLLLDPGHLSDASTIDPDIDTAMQPSGVVMRALRSRLSAISLGLPPTHPPTSASTD